MSLNKWLVSLLLCGTIFTTPSIFAAEQNESKLNRLTIAGPTDHSPFAYMNSKGVYTGYSVDMMRFVGEQVGIENVLFYPASMAESLKALSKGEVDCIHFVPYSRNLARDFSYADFYFESPSVIFVTSDRYDIIDDSDLYGKKIAVLKNDPTLERLKRSGTSFIIEVSSIAEGFLMLASEKVDGFIGERLSSLHYIGTQKLDEKIKIVDREVGLARYGVLIKKDRNDLKKLFKRILEEMETNGSRERIRQRWFGEDVKSQRLFSRPITRWVMIFVGSTLLVSVIVLGWNLLLQRELEIKAIAVEKVNLNRKIAEEKSRFEAIVQSLTEGLMLVDPQCKIAYINAPGAQYLGRREEDLMDHSIQVIYDFLLSKVRKPDRLSKRFKHAEANPSKPIVIEYTITKTKRLDIRMKFFPVRDRQGEFAGRGLLIEDVTHERELDRLKSEFVSIASHELRTPMTSILGFSEIMLTKKLPGDLLKRYTNQIHSEAERLTRILNDMLDLSYLESGESELEKYELNMVDLVNSVVDNFRAQLKDRRELKMEIAGQPKLVMGDRDKLTQVLWNLLSNADKYSPEGKEVVLKIMAYQPAMAPKVYEMHGQSIEQEGLVLQVTDYGKGIPKDQLTMIFIPFYRVETAVHTIRGTGLGLAIVKRIVEAHNGKVWANSTLNKKTTFSLFLPVSKKENDRGENRA